MPELHPEIAVPAFLRDAYRTHVATLQDAEPDSVDLEAVPIVDDHRLLEALVGKPWTTLTPHPRYL